MTLGRRIAGLFLKTAFTLISTLFLSSQALAQFTPTSCTATLTTGASGARITVPYLVYKNAAFNAAFDLVPTSDGVFWFRLANLSGVTGSAGFANCPANHLSSDFYLNLPALMYGANGYSVSMLFVPGANVQNPADIWFKLSALKPITMVTVNKTYSSGLTIAAEDALVISNTSNPASTTLEVQGDFACRGDLDIWDGPSAVQINVTGKADLACTIRFAKESAVNKVTIVASKGVNVLPGFSTPASGHLILTDDATLIKSPDAYLTDSNTDDGVTPSIIPSTDSTPAAADTATRSAETPRTAAACTTTNTLAGSFAPPAGRRVLPQGGSSDTPIVLAAWFQCNVQIDKIKVTPPRWDDPAPSGAVSGPGSAGKKGLTLNLKSEGKITFTGDSIMTLMDGGRRQDQSRNGNPAVATGGNGGASGDLKIAAAGGFDFSAGTLTIVPGRGGDGGNAIATGTAGLDGCPGQAGGAATATGGAGAESKKTLKARGFDPTGKVFVSDIKGGHGGNAEAYAGAAGNGTAGKCNGGAGGNASAQAGKGGDASFKYSGLGAVGPTPTLGGNGGNAISQSGQGGNGGNMTTKCDVGGSGGAGGTSTAKGGNAGNGSIKGDDGAANASGGMGTGGQCGSFLTSNGTGGNWSEFVAGTLRNNGQFNAGTRDCSCTVPVPEPKISLGPTEVVFTHFFGVSACPTPLGSLTISNSGTGSFTWKMGSLPAWLSASKTSGSAGDTINLFFTCTGYSASMSTTVSITGINTATGQALPTAAGLPVSGAVK